jgi:hypothetical protein
MTNEPTQNGFLTGDFISENAVRGVIRRRRRARSANPPKPADGLPSSPTVANADTSQPPTPQPLRRWSVAQLIARAVASPPLSA